MMDAAAIRDGHPALPFLRHHAFIIGVDAYRRVTPLGTAAADARRLAEVLERQQHFEVHTPLIDADAAAIRALLRREMPDAVGPDDRVFFYFAGHGIATDGVHGPSGAILPADADPSDAASLIPMPELQAALEALPCRHLLLVLDCCFAGAFQWGGRTRDIGASVPKKLYRERFDRFVRDPAWQVITSAAYDQKALDVLQGRATGQRGADADDAPHSPFALALFDGLAGAADGLGNLQGDGVITAQKLHAYIRDQVEPATIAADERRRQTPGYFTLRRHDKGEFVFLKPNHILNLPPIPPRSPYKGLASFDEDDQLLFFGRERVIRDLRANAAANRLLVVSGTSGTGKSSVVKAGLLPVFRAEGHPILPVMRPGEAPLEALDAVVANLPSAEGAMGAVLVIDQFEELVTRCANQRNERETFPARLAELLADPRIHRIVVTVRSDFEPQLRVGVLRDAWRAGRTTVPPLNLEELRAVVAMPALQEVLLFEPPELATTIVEEVAQAPGPLPLLSYALDELYERYRLSGREDRKLLGDDYTALGGVMGALRTKAEALLAAFGAAERAAMRKVMLRMVSVEGGIASRRVPVQELIFPDAEEPVVAGVVAALVESRLVVRGDDYIEPAHDALVRGWGRLYDWVREAGTDALILLAQLNAAQREYAARTTPDFLWHDNPKLAAVERLIRDGGHLFNAAELAFARKSIDRRRRNSRVLWSAVAGVFAVIVTGGLYAISQRNQALFERNEALAAQKRAIARQLEATGDRLAVEAAPMLAGQQPGGAELAVQQALAARRLAPASVATKGASLDALVALAAVEKVASFDVAVTALAFSPDGRRLAVGGQDGRVWEWGIEGTGGDTAPRPLRDIVGQLQPGGFDPSDNSISSRAMPDLSVRQIAYLKDGACLASADHLAVSFRATGHCPLNTGAWSAQPPDAAVKASVERFAFTHDGTRMIGAGISKSLILWDLESGRRLGATARLPGTADNDIDRIVDVAIAPDDSLVAAVTLGGTLERLDARHLTSPADLQPIGDAVPVHSTGTSDNWLAFPPSLAFSPDGHELAIGGDGLRLANAKSGRPAEPPGAQHGVRVIRVAFLPRGPSVITANDDGTLALWNGMSIAGTPVLAHEGRVLSLAISADGRRVASGGRDGDVKVWDAAKLLALFNDPRGATLLGQVVPLPRGAAADWGAIYDPRGDRLLVNGSATDNAAPRPWLFDTSSVDGSVSPVGENDQVIFGRFSPTGRFVVTADAQRKLTLRHGRTGERIGGRSAVPANQLSVLPEERGGLGGIVFDKAESRLAWIDEAGHVHVWDTRTGRPLFMVGGGGQAAISADANRALVVSHDGTLRLWDISGTTPRPLPDAGGGALLQGVNSANFSPGGRLVVGLAGEAPYRDFVLDAETGLPASWLADILAKWISPQDLQWRFAVFNDEGDRLVIQWQQRQWALIDLVRREVVGGSPKDIEDGKSREYRFQFGPHGNWLMQWGGDDGVVIRDARNLRVVRRIPEDQRLELVGRIDHIEISHTGSRLLLPPGLAGIWDFRDADTGASLLNAADQSPPEMEPWSRPGSFYINFSAKGRMQFWDMATTRAIGHPLDGLARRHASFNPNGQSLALSTFADDGSITVLPSPRAWPRLLCRKITRNMSCRRWAERVGPHISYLPQCPGLPVAEDDAAPVAFGPKVPTFSCPRQPDDASPEPETPDVADTQTLAAQASASAASDAGARK